MWKTIKDDMRWVVPFALLVWAGALFGCGGGSSSASGPTAPRIEPEPVSEAWRADRGDALNWFLGHREVGASAPIRLDWEGTSAAGVAWHDKGFGFEKHRWDGQFIYLVEDHSGAPNPPYSFSAGVWMPRHFTGYARGRATGNVLTWYGPDCAVTGTQPFQYEWEVSGPAPHDFGSCGVKKAACGILDTLTMRYIWGAGKVEIFYYTWDGGWVDWTYEEGGQDQYRWNHVFDAPDGVRAVHEGSCT